MFRIKVSKKKSFNFEKNFTGSDVPLLTLERTCIKPLVVAVAIISFMGISNDPLMTVE